MAKGDLFKRSLEAGTSFLDMTRERAESIVKEWVDAGDLGKGRAQKAVEQVLDRSRKASDELRTMVRKEIGVQLSAMGVATREDVARLEAKLEVATRSTGPGVADAPPSPRAGVSTAAAEGAAKAGAPAGKTGKAAKVATRAPAVKKAPAKTAPAVQKAPAAKKAPAVKKAAPGKTAPRPGAGPPPRT